MKSHFAQNQKQSIKKYVKNSMSRNGCTITSNYIFQIFQIPINKISKDLLQKQARCYIKKVLLKILFCKIDFKINLTMNLKINSSTVVFFSEYSEILNNFYFVEHRRTAAFSINIDVKYSLLGQ